MYQKLGEQSNCKANKNFEQTDVMIGASFGLYLGLGAEVSIGIDSSAWANELIDIFYEPYVGRL